MPIDVRTALANRYELERELPAGGIATVYAARDIRHDRAVAVKVLRPELAGAISAERFLREHWQARLIIGAADRHFLKS